MERNNSRHEGIGFGVLMGLFFIVQGLLFADHYSSTNIIKIILTGILSGAISGLLFGWIMGKFAKSKLIRHAGVIQLEEGEELVFEAAANHFKGIEGVGGRLFLTSKRLFFKSHKLNIQNHELSIPLQQITGVKRYKTLGLVNNGLMVTDRNEKVEKFVLNEVEELMQLLTSRIKIAYSTAEEHLQ